MPPDDFVLDAQGVLSDRHARVLTRLVPGSWTVLLKRDPQQLRLPAPASAPGRRTIAVPRRAELMFSLLTDSVQQELLFTWRAHGDLDAGGAVDEAVRDCELAPVLQHRLHELSGGEKARVALAIALLARPAVLVLQDTLAAIDSERRARVARALHARGGAVLEVRGQPLEPESPAQCVLLSDAAQVRVLTREAYQAAAPALQPGVLRPGPEPASDPRLSVQGLSYQYPRAFRLLPVSLRARRGEIVRIAGANGSGKTTLMKALAQLVLPDAGTVALNGPRAAEVLRYPVRRRHRGLARWLLYQFQDPDHQIYCSTVREELAETARHVGGAVHTPEQVAAELGLGERLDASPWDLSEGQRRLLTLGSILCADPPLLLADEPTAQLDWVQRDTVLRVLRRYVARGGACLYVAHDEAFNAALGASTVTLPGGLADCAAQASGPGVPHPRSAVEH